MEGKEKNKTEGRKERRGAVKRAGKRMKGERE